MDINNFLEQSRRLIANDEMDKALSHMVSFLEKSPFRDEIFQNNARFQSLQDQIRKGVISNSDASITTNQIRIALLELLHKIDIYILNKKNNPTNNQTEIGSLPPNLPYNPRTIIRQLVQDGNLQLALETLVDLNSPNLSDNDVSKIREFIEDLHKIKRKRFFGSEKRLLGTITYYIETWLIKL